ncbi:hypothetical protein ACFQ08_23190 [Streptosporangium algeriense]|uniref:ESX-1 secretion-associated protein n=1 Tax=Streptosporangium algeriense TaxID=1682748 RepID=A0ABW3DUE0_9ACTN
MSQNIYVTSTCIANIQRNLNERVAPAFEDLKTKVGETDVGFPGFGILGLAFGSAYESTQRDVKQSVADATAAVNAWIGALETIKQNWKDAEEASKVTYV